MRIGMRMCGEFVPHHLLPPLVFAFCRVAVQISLAVFGGDAVEGVGHVVAVF